MSSFRRWIRPAYIILAVFIVLLILGIAWGGFGKVMTNAAVICLDCIGLI